MVRDCYEGFSEKLSGNNGGNDLVLNSNFREWTNHIFENLKPNAPLYSRYEKALDSELLTTCREHADEHEKFERGENVIMLTHPFYLYLAHMDEIKCDNIRSELDEYLNNLMGLLNSDRDKSKMSVVALDMVHHYASTTSLLLERGLVDKVIFTEYDYGVPLDKDELAMFGKGDVFFAGGYNDKCLKDSIKLMEERMSSGNIWAIEELVLNSPQDCKSTLKPSFITGISDSKIIGLSEVVERMR